MWLAASAFARGRKTVDTCGGFAGRVLLDPATRLHGSRSYGYGWIATYIVDQSGRGRSGFDESVIHEGEARIESGDVKTGRDLIPGFGRITDDGAWTSWFGHLVPAGSTILTGNWTKWGCSA